VVNLSLGGASSSRAERDALAAASDVLFVAAAGNDGADLDTTGSYPCEYDLPNVLCVGASERSDALAAFSNHGSSSVDLAAPGVDIASTWPRAQHVLLDGTSMATPHVAGAAALALSIAPGVSAAGLRRLIMDSAEPVPALRGLTVTGGRLDAPRLLAAAGAVPPRSTPVPSDPPEPQPAPPSGGDRAPAPADPTPESGGQPSRLLPPPAAPTRSRDRLAPGASLTSAVRVRLSTLLRRGVNARLACTEACTARIELRRPSGAGRVLSRTSVRVSRAGRVSFGLRLSDAQRSRLRRGTTRTLHVRAVASDHAGNTRAVTRRLSVRRGA
jgi:hypothetical protein